MKNIIAVVAVAVLMACVCADQPRFKGKVALVTGGSSGIGYQTALQFAQEGAKVIIVARDSNTKTHSLALAVKTISEDATVKANGGSVRSYKAELTKMTDVTKLFQDIKGHEGKIDFGINCAGISGPLGPMGTMEYTYGEHDPIENNVYATLNAMTKEEEMMVNTNVSGVIISISAVEGVTPSSIVPRFSASKYAIVGLSNSIALVHITGEDGPYIRSNVVCPGPIATPQLFNKAKYYAEKPQQPWEGEEVTEDSPIWKEHEGNFSSKVPMGRIGRPAEVANTILWLCTDDAAHISGDFIMVDGGMWAA